MLTLAIGLILGFAVNRWWVVAFPILFGLIVGSVINALSIVTVSLAGVIGVAIGIYARRHVGARRKRPGAGG